MKIKKLTAIIMVAATLTMGVSTVAFAEPTTNTATEDAKTTGDTQNDIKDADTNTDKKDTDEDKDKDADAAKGITLTAKYTQVLLEVGQAFDPATDLGVEAIDADEGDLSKALQFNKIDTSKAGLIKYVIEAQNSKKDTATLEIPIRIVNIVDAIKVNSLDEAKDVKVDSLVIDPVEGVTVTIDSVDKEKGNLMVKITDGVNTLTKAIALVDMTGNSLATGTDINKEEAADVTEGDQSALPKTGVMSDLPIATASFLTLVGAGYLATKKQTQKR